VLRGAAPGQRSWKVVLRALPLRCSEARDGSGLTPTGRLSCSCEKAAWPSRGLVVLLR